MAKFEVKLGQRTDVGRERTLNEDSLLTLSSSQLARSKIDGIFVVADGMGGHSAGDAASSYVVETLQNTFSGDAYRQWVASLGVTEDALSLVMSRVIEESNAKLYQASIEGSLPDGMGTTVTAAGLIGDNLHIAHVGDTRAYLIRNGQISQLTRDHSWVAEQVELGVISKEQAEQHPDRNILTRAVGTDPTVEVDVYTTNIQDGDILLLCSDGLCGLVSDAEILQHVLENPIPKQACDKLVQLANARGGPDNITVLIATFVDPTTPRRRETTFLLGPERQRKGRSQATIPIQTPSSERSLGVSRFLLYVIVGILIGVLLIGLFLGAKNLLNKEGPTDETQIEKTPDESQTTSSDDEGMGGFEFGKNKEPPPQGEKTEGNE